MSTRVTLIAGLILLCVSAPSRAQISMGVAEVDEAIEKIGEVIEREHVDPDAGADIRRWLREGLVEGRFPSFYSADDLARGMTPELYELTRDRRFTVSVAKPAPLTATASLLAGNVGYVRLSFLESRQAIADAMSTLRGAGALIIDVRDSRAGTFDAMAAVASYLFDAASMPLVEVTPRSGPATRYTTLAPAVADRNAARPVYVLTSGQTASAGEVLASLVQETKRGETVGEATAASPGPSPAFRVVNVFDVTVPNGIARSLVSARPLGAGVKPDVPAGAAEAQQVAHTRALARVRQGN